MEKPMQAAHPSHFFKFDQDHWLRVKAERTRLGIIPGRKASLASLESHRLLSVQVLDTRTGERYSIDQISREWLQGTYLTATMRSENKSKVLVIENISSENEDVLDQLAEFTVYFQILS